jgi:hypothetical protein
MALKLGDKSWEAGWHYTAQRSVEIFRIWEGVFGGHGRLVRVLPGFAANDYVSDQIASWHDAYKHADALAIAPYLGFMPSPDGTPRSSDVASWSLDRLFGELRAKVLPESVSFIDKNAAVARKYGLKLVAYEGGQHLVGVGGGENDARLTNLFERANADTRIGALYDPYFAAWRKAGGDCFCYFSSTGDWSKWGSWGAVQWADEDPMRSPKYRALVRFSAGCGQSLGR